MPLAVHCSIVCNDLATSRVVLTVRVTVSTLLGCRRDERWGPQQWGPMLRSRCLFLTAPREEEGSVPDVLAPGVQSQSGVTPKPPKM